MLKQVIHIFNPIGRGRRARPLVALAFALMLSSQGCFEQERGAAFYGRVAVPAAQEFRWSDGGLPRVFDPAIAASPPDTDVVRAMFEGLTDYEPRTLAPVPAVATAWEAGEGGRVWTFRLRPEARWSNGDPVTAHDFVRSWKRTLQLGERAPHAGLMRNIEGAPDAGVVPSEVNEPKFFGFDMGQQFRKLGEAAAALPTPVPAPPDFGARASDAQTLVVRLKRPDALFPALVAHPVFRPVHELGAHADLTPAHAGRGKALGAEDEKTLITNGAFRLRGRAEGGVVLERAENYWGASSVQLERVHFVASADAEEALSQYRAGQVDAVTNAAFEPLALKLLAPHEDFRRQIFGALTYYQFNTTRAPFDDLRVRRALALALDRERLSADTLGGATLPAARFLPGAEASAGVSGEGAKASEAAKTSSDEQRAAPLTFDPVRARELLAEAGYAGGAKFPVIRLLVNRNERQRLLAQAVAGMWREVLGVETEVTLKDWEHYESSLAAGDFDIARRSIVMQTPDEERNLLAMFGAAGLSATTPDETDSTPEAQASQAASDSSKAPPTEEAARESVAAITTEAEALRALPAIPVYFATSFALVKPYVAGFDTNLLDAPSLKYVRIETGWKPGEGTGVSPPAATVSGL
ncbi:MAG TPA: peptide ABC transporter substrate-binding protein [Pyrinomonadaceae bacterium]